jgi:hypothetical protein
VAGQIGGAGALLLAHLARSGFISGMDLGLRTAAVVALAGALLSAVALPSRPSPEQED